MIIIVPAGREYVDAYVQFFHFAEGEGEHHHGHLAESEHVEHIPWILTAVLFIVSIMYITLYYSGKRHRAR